MRAARIFAVVVGSLICSSGLAEQIRYADGRTIDGRISRVEPDGISVVHSTGITKVFFSEMPAEDQARHGYDPQAAAQHQQRKAESAKRADETARRVAEERRQALEQDARLQEVEKITFLLGGRISQITDEGALIYDAVSITTSRVEVVEDGYRTMNSNRKFSNERRVKYLTNDEPVFVYGAGYGYIDGQRWEGPVYPAGTYSYETVMGATKTVKKFLIFHPRPQ